MTYAPSPLHDFTRIIWTSQHAREVWEPRIARISTAWSHVEIAAVVAGVKRSALCSVSPEAFFSLKNTIDQCGLMMVTLARVSAERAYSTSTTTLREDEKWSYRVAICKPSDALLWQAAWDEKNDEVIGRLLGFPYCCREFFGRTWSSGAIDTTWEMATNPSRFCPTGSLTTHHHDHGGICRYGETTDVSGDGPVECNILGRWLGVRWVTHLPCSFMCGESIDIGKKMRRVMIDAGYADEAGWIDDILSWPAEWSGLHGIAEIKWPVLKVSTRTNYSAKKNTITRMGTSPAEGARGGVFPYLRGVTPLTFHRPTDSRLWTDNGFSSEAAMKKAHDWLASHIPADSSILDLGAGNGLFLSRFNDSMGIEHDDDRASRGRNAGRDIQTGSICDPPIITLERRFRFAVISVRRFEEMSAKDNRRLLEWCSIIADDFLLYSYDEPCFAMLANKAHLLEIYGQAER